ncbi:oligosaccharide flippase family protein [Microbulbifer bruguierae]|uniref:Oligosaccharide flippase family protein n=1 Tax=Microbulbifer bruguierae TaxID=3029061 RepID=A0ABY8NIE5_9GAMM|nr:oligosaccharide flippase family protein [Microbulbifer bruguierae]WGL18230.1 oligosaccharide flippase family protein [Microbulbifer bruguierae]
MSVRYRILKGASVLSVSQALVAISSMLRNIIIARHIDSENFGIATTFALTISLVEMTSNLALDRVLVQDDEGDSDGMLASAHLLQFVKGLLLALLLFLIAAPVARLFGLPHLISSFQLIALVPALHGLLHFDLVVRQRHLDFLPTALFDTLPELLTLLTACLASLLFDDYRVMLVVIILQSLLCVIASHLLARRPYRWTFDWRLVQRKLRFGWPLLINGFLMFGIFQGDRVIIGSNFDMHVLGWYSVAFSLSLLPTLIFAKLSAFLLMPVLARNRDKPEFYLRCCTLALTACTCFGLLMVIGFTLAGSALIHLSFGTQYLEASSVIGLLGIMQALRVLRIAPSIIANSQGRTENAMIANVFRSFSLPLALYLASAGYPVQTVAACGIGGEVVALAISVYLAPLAEGKSTFVRRLITVTACATAVSAIVFAFGEPLPAGAVLSEQLLQLCYGAGVALTLAGLLSLTDPDLRREYLHLWWRYRVWARAERPS